MFTTGSKLLIGSAVAAWILAAVYGIAQEGALGTIGLVSVAVAMSLLAALNIFVRDANVSATDHESFESSAAAQATDRPSLWPLLVALGATTVTLGLATFPVIFVIGVVLIVVGALEWLVQGWSERASADSRFNAHARDVFADPIELPVAGALLFAGIVYGLSRVMLGVPSKAATVIVFSIVGAVVLLVGGLIAVSRGVSRQLLTGLYSVGAVALIVGGSIAGLNGERETHAHVTTADIAAADECGAAETEADHHGSQTVSSKSSLAATVSFDGSELAVEVPGFDPSPGPLTVPRSAATNLLFRNDADHPARLVAELHPAVDDKGDPIGPERICTTLVDEGGVQLMTVEFDRPSFALAAEGVEYSLVVPGSDASLEVVAP